MAYFKILRKAKSFYLYADDDYLGFIYKRDFEDLKLEYRDEDEFILDDIGLDIIEDIRALVIKRAFDKAVSLATVSETAASIVRNKLLLKNYPEYAIDAAIKMMYEYNYLNDERYIESYTRCYVGSKSRFMIEKELALKGLNVSDYSHVIDSIYEDEGLSDDEIIERLIERKFRGQNLEDEKVKKRVVSFLVRHGFSFERINNYLT